MSKPLWACIICAEDFTRKSSAKRHMDNISIHNERPVIVRYMEYIIGTGKGIYPPPITPPRLQRKINKAARTTYFSPTTDDDNNTIYSKAIPDSMLDPVSRSNFAQPRISHNNCKTVYITTIPDPTEQQLDEAAYKEQSWPLTESQDTLSSKFEKIKKMSRPYFSSKRLDVILENLARRVFYDGGNDHSVDEYLAELRQKINQMEAFDHLSPSKRRMSSTDISEERMQQGSVGNASFRDLHPVLRLS